jgi:hypothetical protein
MNKFYQILSQYSAGADGGLRSRVCARKNIPWAPIDTSINLSAQIYVLEGGSKIVDPPKLLTLNPVGHGETPNFVSPQILFFSWLKTPHKILEHYDNSFWEKSNGPGEKEREKTPLIADP